MTRPEPSGSVWTNRAAQTWDRDVIVALLITLCIVGGALLLTWGLVLSLGGH